MGFEETLYLWSRPVLAKLGPFYDTSATARTESLVDNLERTSNEAELTNMLRNELSC